MGVNFLIIKKAMEKAHDAHDICLFRAMKVILWVSFSWKISQSIQILCRFVFRRSDVMLVKTVHAQELQSFTVTFRAEEVNKLLV